ncbi:leucine-rich repeat containing protein [Capsaspora owczarzaki ATCC 30864]|uniref:Leucine-rich repeat containing protein n=1 Tax=Capsaspora owczarzaki (strain ATCC 30864) TaxID=595528 RepID=A0A0D2U8J9_CAPO3|nr:leucine-rich repeat containing protein [Capsaspora owczarzaki ATCC 30864]KJE91411.1 leucine-rich repeat containing protein [Capsaspora owczarzaki ATCC 30864]|eukprot:XP_004349297.2 leucine-rich repeat containing protein [Capsaspora owczarzaki ATCC 30864]
MSASLLGFECYLETQLVIDALLPTGRPAKGSHVVMVLAKPGSDGNPVVQLPVSALRKQPASNSNANANANNNNSTESEPPQPGAAPTQPAESTPTSSAGTTSETADDGAPAAASAAESTSLAVSPAEPAEFASLALAPALAPASKAAENGTHISLSLRDGVCLVVFNAKIKSGVFYPIYKNVRSVFTKFVGEGRATIELQQPHFRLFISKANPKRLDQFLGRLHRAFTTPAHELSDDDVRTDAVALDQVMARARPSLPPSTAAPAAASASAPDPTQAALRRPTMQAPLHDVRRDIPGVLTKHLTSKSVAPKRSNLQGVTLYTPSDSRGTTAPDETAHPSSSASSSSSSSSSSSVDSDSASNSTRAPAHGPNQPAASIATSDAVETNEQTTTTTSTRKWPVLASAAYNPFITPSTRKTTLKAQNLATLDQTINAESTVIKAAGLQLKAIPSTLLELKQLTSLDLSANMLRELPAAFVQLAPTLAVLNLQHNQLSELPLLLSKFDRLSSLTVSNNQIRRIPARLCWALPSLVRLDLNNNKLTSLPADIDRLPALRGLHIAFNQLCHIPHEILRLRLQDFDTSGNPFVLDDEIKSTSFEFPSLYELAARATWRQVKTGRNPREKTLLAEQQQEERRRRATTSAFNVISRAKAAPAPPHKSASKLMSVSELTQVLPLSIIEELAGANWCSECKDIFLRSYNFGVQILSMRNVAENSVLHQDLGEQVPVLHRWCSPKCAAQSSLGNRIVFGYHSPGDEPMQT